MLKQILLKTINKVGKFVKYKVLRQTRFFEWKIK